MLRKSRGFTLVAATSLALAIGANTTIFSVAKQLLFERLDVPNAANLRLLASADANFSFPMYEQLRAQNQVLGDLLAFHATAVNATVGENAERVLAHEVSGNYYAVLGVQPQLGRAIRPVDDTAGSEPVVVISDEFWEREFTRSPTVLGQSIKLNDVQVTIVGVNPTGFTGAASTLPSQTPAVIVALAKATLVTPSSNGRNWLADPTSQSVNILARNAVGIHFFDTLGIPIVAGRAFGVDDTVTSPKVAVINQRLAAARFPNQNPIGKRVSVGVYAGYGAVLTAGPIEIVGVCGDTLYGDLHGAPPPQLFIPYVQQTQVRRLTYQIRTLTKPETIVPALRRVVHAADPALPLVNVRTQQDQIDSDLADERLLVSLTSAFGLLALVLASVGIYGVMAYSVAQRTKEIGIRMALGAIPRQILTMVLREASSLSAAAIALGMGASFLVTRFVKSMLFGIAPSDPATLWGAAVLLMIVALGTSWIPARRAASVQPMEALRRD